jgi:hypothetical protein
MDRLAGEPRRIPNGLLQRIRWVNVARLMFVAALAVVLVGGDLPAVGGGSRSAPDLGLPESVLSPPVPTAGASRPLPLKRISAPKARVKRALGRRSVRRRNRRPRRAPRVAGSPTAPASPGAAYVAPSAPGTPAVGEFGP